MATVLLTGGSGLIGRHLCRCLKEKGYEVTVLSRSRKNSSAISTYIWDIEKMEIEGEAIDNADYIIHLAGENIGEKRWTARRKQQIINSRIKTGQLLFEKVREQHKNLKAFISASAVGYYGAITSKSIFSENDPPADDFLGETCKKWEQTADRFQESGIRTVKIRTGIVLTKQGGVLSRLLTPVIMGIGSAIGNGKQYMPWIHIEDLCGIYIKAIEDVLMEGAYNAVAPDQKTNEEFTLTIARVCKKPFWFPHIPGFIIRLLLGEMSKMLLKGSRISSDKIQRSGYKFMFPDLESALTDLIPNK